MLEQRIKETLRLLLSSSPPKLTDGGRAKPYETFSMNMSTGYASPIAYFPTLPEALALHDQLVVDAQKTEASKLRR